ncbi:hypothetical protein BSZ32_11825 [Rubritalea profundi]|uniref:Sulfatase-modifying factor enzyme domain-containing protein n=2 Tax=Rubritalea profundi TaxID=1658618 RepID=A0A2S7U3V3_9BACT|nr:hypothetical protein BSZ32_11825 [Rubritalea profundi]
MIYGAALMAAPMASADSFGTGGNAFTMDFVNIGNAGNVGDGTGYGSVDNNFRMGTHEVSESMIDSYNALSAGPDITQSNRGMDSPSTNVSWNEAARFVNWLNTSSGHSAAYQFDIAGGNDNIALWDSGDAGYEASNRFRNSNAHYFLPSENEMYKAAYYDPNKSGGAGYWDYATGSDTASTTTSGGVAAGTAVYSQSGPADVTKAGGLSAYGTMGQGGNVWEWSESGYDASNDSAAESRVFRGGGWFDYSLALQSSTRNGLSPGPENSAIGFRVAAVAAVPEPSSVTLLVLGAISLLMRRKRG